MSTIRQILVADRDHGVVQVLRHYLESAQFRVLATYDGKTTQAALYRQPPDLLSLDPVLPDVDGWEMLQQLRTDSALADLPIIVLTTCSRDNDKILGLELGADDYVCKPFNPREMVARVQAVLRRTRLHASQVLEYGDIRMDIAQHQVLLSDRAIALTPTEFDLLYTLMTSPGHTFTRSALIEQSRGADSDSLDRTIDTHIKNLRKKLELASRQTGCIQTVYGIGYRLEAAL